MLFADIPGATAITYDPSVLSTTTAYRRSVFSNINGVQCPSNVVSASSNVVTITVDPASVPVVSFNSGLANNVLCDGDTVTFDASGTTGASSYEFFVGGLSQGAASAVSTFTPSVVLTDQVTVTVRAYSSVASSCQADQVIIIRVVDFAVSNTVSSSQSICEGSTPAQLTGNAVTSTIGTVAYQWQSRQGANPFADISGATAQNYTATTGLTTTTEFQRIANATFNGVSCSETSNVITIAVTALPVATLTGTNTACTGEVVNFTASGGVTYEFFRNGVSLSASSTTATLSRTDLVTGDQITVEVTNTDGCMSVSAATVMSISNPPAAALSSGLTAETMCEGDFPIFTASPGSAGLTYTFYVNGGIQTTGVTTNSFNTQLAGVNLTDGSTVLVEVSNADGCTGSASLTIRVNGLTGANTITGSQTICSGGDPTILNDFSTPTANLAADGATVSYQWQSRTSGNAFANIPGATAITYDPSVLSTTTAYRRSVFSNINGVQCPSNVVSASSNVVTITVDPASVPVVSFNSGLANNVLCDGDTVTFDASGTTGASSYEFFVGGLSQGAASAVSTFTPSVVLTDQVTVTVRAYSSVASSCQADQVIIIRVVDFAVSNTVSSSQSICEGSTPAQLTGNAVTSTIGTVAYQWQSRQGANPFADISGATAQNYTATTGLTTTTEFQRIANATFNGVSCSETSNVITIAVTALPVATLTGTNTACTGEVVNFTASGGVTYEFFRNGVSLSASSTTATLSRTDLVTGDQITVEVTNTDGCMSVSAATVMSISNPPAAALSSGLIAETMCEGDFPIFTASPGSAGLTYTFYVNGGIQTTGVTTNSFNTQLAGVNLTDGSTVLVEVSNADGCTGSASLTIRVNGLTGANTITGSQTICSGGDPTILNDFSTPTANLAADGATVSYQWQSRTSGNAFANIPGATAITYDPSVLSTTTAYRRSVFSNINGVQCPSNVASASSNVVTITVDPASVPVVSFNSGLANNVLCDGDTVTFDASGTTGASSYEFFVGGLSQGAASAVSTFTPVPGTITNGITVRVVAYSSSASSCQAEQSIVMIVNTISNNTLDTVTSSQTICSGDVPTQLTGPSATPTSTMTYQWQSRQGTNTFADISGANLQTYSFSSPLFATTSFRRQAINTISGVACTSISNVVTVTVSAGPSPPATLTSDRSANTACAGDAFLFTATGNVSSSFEFFVNGVTQGAASAVNTISLVLNNNDTVRVDVFPLQNGVGCPTTVNVPVSVNTIVGNNTIGGIQTICFGDDPGAITSINTPTSSTGSITYQWQSRTMSGTFSDISSGTLETFDPTNLNVTTLFRRNVISTFNGIPCVVNSNVVTITVDPTPIINGTLTSDQPSNTVCSDDAGMIVFSASPGGANSYDFYLNGIAVQTTSTIQTYTTTISTLSDGDVVSVEFVNASGCSSLETLTVNVNDILPGSISGAQTVCSGDTPLTLTSAASGTINGTTVVSPGTGSYQWQSSPDGVTWNNILGATSDSFTPPAAPPPATYYRRMTVNTMFGVTCSVPSNDVLVSVNALPNPGLIANPGAITAAATMSICASDTISFIGSGGVEYAFLKNGIVEQSRSASNTFVINTLSNSDEITVIAYDSSTASACFAVSDAIEIIIDAAPVATLSANVANNTFCSGDNVTFTAGSGGIAAQYEFRINTITRQNTSSSTFDPSDYSLSLNGGDLIEVIVSSASGCTSVASLTLIENIISSVGTVTSSTVTLCFGETPAALTGSTASASGTITYQWQQSLDNTTYSDISGAVSQNYTPTSGLSSSTYFVRKTISTFNSVVCEDSSLPYLISVSPQVIPSLSALPGSLVAPSTMSLCIDETATFSGSGGASYQFFVNGVSVRARSAVNTAILSSSATGTLINNSTVYVRVFDTLTGVSCSEDSQLITVNVSPKPTVGITSSQFNNEICDGDLVTFTANSTAASPTFEFYVNSVSEQVSTSNIFDPALYSITIDGGDLIEVVVTSGAGCNSDVASLTIIENTIATVGTISSTVLSVCSGETIPALTGSAGVASGTITYQWQSRSQSTLFTNLSGATSQNYTPTAALTTDTFFRRQTISTLSSGFVCSENSNFVEIRVDAAPAANITANISGVVVTGGSSATICAGEEVSFIATAVAGASYEFTIDGAVVRARADSNVYTTTALIAGQQVGVRVFDQLTAAAPAGCSADSASITIAVTPVPTLTVTSTAFGNEICAGDAITFYANASIAGATYEFFVNSTPIQNSVSQTFDPGAYSLVIAGGDVIEVRASTGAASCSTAVASITVQTNAISTVGTITATSLTACLNDPVPALTGTAGVASGTVSYQWQSRDQTTSVYSDIFGATSQNYTPTTLLTTDTFYRRLTVSNTGTTTCDAFGNIIEIRVDAAPAANITANISGVVVTGGSSATICAGEEVSFIATAVAGASYEFTIDGTVVRARADSNVYTTTALIAGQQVGVRVFDQLTAAAPAGCSADSASITIAVTPVPTLTVTSTAFGNEICAGDAITFYANASIAGATYEFFVNSTPIQNSVSQTFDPGAYSLVIAGGDVIEVRASTGAASCSTAVASITVQTNAISTVGTITATSLTACLNDPVPALTGTAGVASGTVSYQWQSRDQTTSVYSDIFGATSQNYTPTTLLTTDTFYRRLTVSNTGTTTCDAFGNIIEIRVDAAPAANITANISGVVVTGGSSATICAGEEVSFIATAVAGASYEFTIDGAVVRARADSNVYTTTALIAGQQVGVRVFDQLTAAAPAGCSADSASITIAVTPVPTLTVTSTAFGNEICAGDAITFYANASIAGATYEFFVNSTPIQNSVSQTFDPGAYSLVIAGGDVIEVRASTGAASCSTAVASITVQTNAISTVGTITATSLTACLNDPVPALTGTAGVASGTVSYQWQSRDQTTSVYSDIFGATSQNYTPTTLLTTDTFYRRLTVSNTGTTTCDAFGNIIEIRVDAAPAANITANISGVVVTGGSSATICAGEEVSFIATAVAGASYEFTIDGAVVRARADSNVYTTTALIAGQQVGVRVFDQLTAAAPAGCSADSASITIAVTPVPTLTVTSTAFGNEICAGDAITFYANASIAGATYEFFVNSTPIQNSVSQTFDPGAYSLVIAGGDVIEVRASTGAASCSTAVASITVQTNAISTVGTITATSLTACLNDPVPALTGTAGVASGTVSYQWQSRDQTTSVYSDIFGATSQNYTPTTLLTTDTFYRRLTVSNTGTTTCDAFGNIIEIRVDAAPAANITANISGVVVTGGSSATICAGEEVSFIATAVAGASYEFTIDGAVVRARADSNVYTTTALIAGQQVGVRVFDQLTAAAPAGCSADSASITIAVTPVPTLTVTSTAFGNEICAGDAITFYANASIAGATYEFFVNSTPIQNSVSQTFDPGAYSLVIAGGDVIEVRASTGAASCSTAVASITVQTNAISTVGTITATSLTACLNDPVPALTGTAGVASGTVSYQWQSRDQTTSVYSDIFGATSQNYTPTTLLTTDTFYRRLTVSNTGTTTCDAFGNIIEIRVDAAPAANITANISGVVVTGGSSATICAGEEVSFIATAVAGASYEFTIDGAVVRARADSNVYTTTALIAGQQVGVRVFDQLTAAAPAGCSADSASITIAVTPVPTLTVTSTAFGNEICAGDAITFYANASIAGATYEFFVNSTPIQNSVSQTFDPGAYSLVIAGGDVIEVRASTGAASCSTAVASITVQTNAISTVGTITATSLTACLNDPVPALTGTAGVASGTVSYQWQSRDQTTSVYSDIFGATSQNYTPTTLLTTDTFYRRLTVSNTGTTTCDAFGNIIEIRVDAAPAANITANISGVVVTGGSSATICAGEEVSFIATAVAGASYEFTIDGAVVRARADSNVYTTTALIAGQQVGVRVFDQLTAAAPAGCSADSASITIAVTPVPTLTVTSTAFGNEICAGDAITFYANASIAGANYEFSIDGVSFQNSTVQSFDPAVYGQTISNGNIIEVIASTGVASCSSAVVSITIFENVISSAGTITTSTPTICIGTAAPPIIGSDQTGMVSGTLSYQWEVSVDNNVTYTDITGAISQNYTPTTLLSTDTFFRRRTVSTTGNSVCDLISNAVKIEVDLTPIATLSAIQSGVTMIASNTLNICVGEEIIFSASPNNAGLSYTFTIDGIVVQARSGLSTYTSSGLSNNEEVRVEVFNGLATDTTACGDLSDRFLIQTLPTPIPTLIANTIANTFCTGEDITFTAGSNLASNTYRFFIGSIAYQTGTSTIFRPSTLTPPITINDNDIISVEVTSNPTSLGACSAVASLTMIENRVTNPGLITTSPTTICSGSVPSPLTNVASATAVGAVSYSWETSLDSVTFSAIPGTNSSTYVPGSLALTTYFRRAAISTLNGKTCIDYSNIIEITVTPVVVGGSIAPTAQTICSGDTPAMLQVVGGSTGLGISYQWQDSPDGIVFTDIATATSQDYTPRCIKHNTIFPKSYHCTRWGIIL